MSHQLRESYVEKLHSNQNNRWGIFSHPDEANIEELNFDIVTDMS